MGLWDFLDILREMSITTLILSFCYGIITISNKIKK